MDMDITGFIEENWSNFTSASAEQGAPVEENINDSQKWMVELFLSDNWQEFLNYLIEHGHESDAVEDEADCLIDSIRA